MRVKHVFLLPCDLPKYGCHLAANSYDVQAYDSHASEYVTSVSIERSKNNEDYAICVRWIRIDCCAPSKWKFVVPPPLSPSDLPLRSYIGWANIYSPFADVTCQITRNTRTSLPLIPWDTAYSCRCYIFIKTRDIYFVTLLYDTGPVEIMERN